MKSIGALFVVILGLHCASAGAQIPMSQPWTAEVVKVLDGDTLQIKGSIRVRLASVDAPETGHGPDRPGQPFSRVSAKAVDDMLGRSPRTITLFCYEMDKYARAVCDATTSDGRNIGQHLVSVGLAWVNQAGNGRYVRDRRLLDIEQTARARGMGLWASNAVAPWQWRQACWVEKRCE